MFRDLVEGPGLSDSIGMADAVGELDEGPASWREVDKVDLGWGGIFVVHEELGQRRIIGNEIVEEAEWSQVSRRLRSSRVTESR